VFDGSKGKHDEAKGGIGEVQGVGALDGEAHPAVESLVAGVVHAQANGGEDACSALGDGVRRRDEGFEATAGRLRAEPVEEDGDVVFAEVAGEDGPSGFFAGVGPPQVPAAALQLAQGGGLVAGQVTGVLQQRPARPCEALGGLLVRKPSQVLPDRPADLVKGLGGELDDVQGVVDEPARLIVRHQREIAVASAEPVKHFETRSYDAFCVTSSLGSLIHATVGSFDATGHPGHVRHLKQDALDLGPVTPLAPTQGLSPTR